MPTFRIFLITFGDHSAVNVHAWDDAGDIRDVTGTPLGQRLHEFTLDMSAPDPTRVSFKFWYPEESPAWEKEEYVRHVPAVGSTVWTTEFSSRCVLSDPRAIPALPAGTTVTVRAITANRFAGGKLYAWDPASGRSHVFPEKQRDHANNISSFDVTLDPWMTAGFHFKLSSADGGLYEPEQANRFWRPVDGQAVYIKSGQVEVRATAPVLVDVPISVIVPAGLAANTALHVSDAIDDFSGDAMQSGVVTLDPEFVALDFTASLYPNALYNVTPRIDASAGTQAYRPQWSLPLRVTPGTSLTTRHTLLGVSEWYATRPTRDAVVDLHIHANPKSTFGASLDVPWHLGFARRTQDEIPAPVAGTATARTAGRGVWIAKVVLFDGVPQWIDTLRSATAIETRADGPSLSQREVRPSKTTPTILHTVDGQSGVSFAPPAGSLFKDVSPGERARLMKTAFSSQIVDAGVFASYEMPHGATWHDGTLWFVLSAPHAIQVSVLLLDRAASSPDRRALKIVPMTLTPDLRYWWCQVPRAGLPDPDQVEYRFSLDEEVEVLDPASRQASLAEYVWPEADEGLEGAWSIVVDRAALAVAVAVPEWRTPFWNEFMIYELHAQRFTDRNNGATPLPALSQVEEELPRYLASLPVTALELLPINEFPKYISWGYNSSLYFAIESSYGGPAAFASLVRSAHAAGKAVLLDVVFNHLTDSPMQATARDVFADGKTQWGDMVNYDHPACLEFFRQAAVYLYDTLQVDGFRFDATQAMVNGHLPNPYIIRDGRVGSGGGWRFLLALHTALDGAASACGRRLPYIIAESKANVWEMDGMLVDSQWDFDYLGNEDWAATCSGDAAPGLAGVLMTWRNSVETVRATDTHDSCSTQDPNERRIAARGPWGTGMRMAKACGALTLLSKGIPMFFMGAEAGETKPFFFDVPQSGDVLPLDEYEARPPTEKGKVLAWYRALLGLRKNWGNGFAGNDTPYIGKGHRTIAFTRNGGQFFVIVTFGTNNPRQDLARLGLPDHGTYKEVFNSTWPDYNVAYDDWSDNGGYSAQLNAGTTANLPHIGAIILERA